jgi:hypothetical protein
MLSAAEAGATDMHCNAARTKPLQLSMPERNPSQFVGAKWRYAAPASLFRKMWYDFPV